MQSLESVKRSIASAQELESITRTMKTLAAVSIRQYEQAVESLVEYANTVERGIQMILRQVCDRAIVRKKTDLGPSGIIVFGTDQGMCGQFNEQIASYAVKFTRSEMAEKKTRRFIAIGSRAASSLSDRGCEIDHVLSLPSSATGISELIVDLLAALNQWRRERLLHSILVVYNRRVSVVSTQPHHLQLLPIAAEKFVGRSTQSWDSKTLPKFTMKQGLLLSRFVQQHIFVSLFRAAAESLAGENASRIASMQAAERSIQERLTDLQSEYNQRRQTSITEELLDVVMGYEALFGSHDRGADI